MANPCAPGHGHSKAAIALLETIGNTMFDDQARQAFDKFMAATSTASRRGKFDMDSG